MASSPVSVTLMSGKTVQIACGMESSLRDLKLQAQAALKTGRGVLRSSGGQVLDVRQTLAEAGVKPGDALTLQTRQTALAAHRAATSSSFCAILGDGCAATWGDRHCGGRSGPVQEQLRSVRHVQATARAFAAILESGSVVTWGHPEFGGDSSSVQEQLSNVERIQSNYQAFAAILDNGNVVTWKHAFFGGDSSDVQEQLVGVQHIQATLSAFAAILGDGSVVTWGLGSLAEAAALSSSGM